MLIFFLCLLKNISYTYKIITSMAWWAGAQPRHKRYGFDPAAE